MANPKAHKNADIAILAAVAGIFILSPAIGYFLIDEVRKGVIYLILGWVIPLTMIIAFSWGGLFLGALTFGLGCLAIPFGLIGLVLLPVIAYDVYAMAKGKKGVLPG